MQPRDQLTAKEIQVATLVWQGLTNREIAKIVGTTEQVVKNYLRSTFDKIGVWSRLELALYVAAHGGSRWVQELGLDGAASPAAERAAVAYAGLAAGVDFHSVPSQEASRGRGGEALVHWPVAEFPRA